MNAPLLKRVIVLGAGGSIGRQTIDVIRQSASGPHRLELAGFSVHSDRTALLSLRREFPSAVAAWTGDSPSAPENADLTGPSALEELLSSTDASIVVNGIASASGLSASMLALQHSKDLALANKESIVMGYRLLAELAERTHTRIIPVDSEHAGLFQLLHHIDPSIVTDLTITASGGPFRTLPLARLPDMTANDACQHPVWKMGRKISIDSATMANKGLELIEASRLFAMPQRNLQVLIHPQSYIHAMVRTLDGAQYAQISRPDMRLPIHDALFWPSQESSPFGVADLAGRTLEFFEPEQARYPMLWIARDAIDAGEAACIVFNAANEIAVDHFDRGNLRFTQIASLVSATLERDWNLPIHSFEDIFDIDMKARSIAASIAEHLA